VTASRTRPPAGIAATAEALAESLALPPLAEGGSGGWRHQSLSRGAAGVTILHGTRAQAGLGGPGRVHAWLSLAVRDGISTGTGSGLWFGAPAVAFAIAASASGGYPAAQQALKQAVADMTRARLRSARDRIAAAARPPLSEFDLVRGLTGLGAYFLHFEPDPSLLREVLAYLVLLTKPVPAGDAAGIKAPGWWTAGNPSV
jgi:lantibiotic biosynthesis protein